LWSEAARLARCHGISPIATAVGLGYYGLRRRVETMKEIPASANRPAFVEIKAPPSVIPPNCAGIRFETPSDPVPPART
jgi:hypothetical protein